MSSAGSGALGEGSLVEARRCFERRAWGEAFRRLSAARREVQLDVADLERLAVAAYLTGHDEASDDAWTLAHETSLAAGDEVGAGRSAGWLSFQLLLRGDMARAGGWLARANTLLVEGGHDCAARGLLLVPEALFQLDEDPAGAFRTFALVGDYGERFSDRDLVAIGRLGCGEALIAQGAITKGMALLDEAMVAVTAGEVTAPIAGVVYCAVLLACHKAFDARRAREWSGGFTRWCDAQPDLVPYRGACLVHRSEVLQLGGDWTSALELARRACEALAGHPAIGDAYYQRAEMHRLRGEYGEADAAYRGASRFGRDPHPGLALLRLAQGDAPASVAAIRRSVEEARDPSRRTALLAACVEIMLTAGDAAAARRAAEELVDMAEQLDAPLLRARAQQARGAVLLAAGDTGEALELFRGAWSTWQEVGAPYECAQARASIGEACRLLGDAEAAAMELDAARAAFESLGATPDSARLSPPPERSSDARPGGLTAREAEVLALVAAGRSNHEIAEALGVSDHTVRRHLQNIFPKIGVTSRVAATAYAFTHGLV